ncbi:MAG: UDP-N-acetylmuramoyl-tripeptide--D-alanyl-D-alanine ligase [Parcubacteria group bacterium]|nr:UDP-N-acetylmuramoyl-tripeptide--D-alanyl-D-alanine ligase [Parcubacteria group bacterium]
MAEKISRKIIQRVLRWLAKLTIKRYRPRIVGVTGSVGKTSTKEAVYLVLQQKYSVRRSSGNYNNEIGIPLTILGATAAGRSILGWLGVFIKSSLKIIYCRYPQIIILEMGVDRPGDMDYLLDFIKLDVGILTKISSLPAHLEFFKSVEKLAQEKIKLVSSLGKGKRAIINADDPIIKKHLVDIKASSLTFGIEETASVKASNIVTDSEFTKRENGIGGVTFKLQYKKSIVPVRLPYILARHQIYAALAAAASGIALGLNLVEISQALAELKPAPGRMSLLSGIKNSYLIDDTYNASPDSVTAALMVLGELKVDGKKIAVLGDMKELGDKNEEGHRKVGRLAATADILVTVGESAKFIADQALQAGLAQDQIFQFAGAVEAGKFIQNNILQEGDLALVKGSQAMRMEKIVKELMTEPLRASELLVRQEEYWLE